MGKRPRQRLFVLGGEWDDGCGGARVEAPRDCYQFIGGRGGAHGINIYSTLRFC